MTTIFLARTSYGVPIANAIFNTRSAVVGEVW